MKLFRLQRWEMPFLIDVWTVQNMKKEIWVDIEKKNDFKRNAQCVYRPSTWLAFLQWITIDNLWWTAINMLSLIRLSDPVKMKELRITGTSSLQLQIEITLWNTYSDIAAVVCICAADFHVVYQLQSHSSPYTHSRGTIVSETLLGYNRKTNHGLGITF